MKLVNDHNKTIRFFHEIEAANVCQNSSIQLIKNCWIKNQSPHQVNDLKIIILIASFFLISQLAFGQSSIEKIKFTRLDLNEGLSNSNITRIVQDSKGFIWIGTGDGLNKYDGYNFTVYRKNPGDTTGLWDNNICYIYEDSKKILWVSLHGGGICRYDPLMDRFVAIPEISGAGEISTITEDNNHTLWVTGLLNSKAFFANLNRTTNKWELHYNSSFPSNDVITGIIQDSEDEYWLTVKLTGLFKWNRKTNELKKFQKEGLNNYLQQFIKDQDGNLWLATRNGLMKFNPKTSTYKNFKADLKHPESSVPVNAIRVLCIDGTYLWIGTENGGLCKMEIRTETFTHFTFNKNDKNSISDNSIWDIYKDHQDRIWVGTYSKGLCMYDKMKDKFQELSIPLNNDVVNAIWIDKKERMWIGTEHGLTMREGNHVQQFTHQQNNSATIPNNPILTIFEDSKNRLWFGTWDGGLSLYNEKQNNFKNYIPQSNNQYSLSNPSVFSIQEESATHRILVSTYNGLNILVDEQHGKFEKHMDEQYANNYLRVLFEDKNKTLWLGSISVLSQYNLKTRSWTKYLFNKRTGLGVSINCITEDHKGNLWVGSDKGLFQLRNNIIVDNITSIQGLPSDIINGILMDAKENLWLGTSKGISKFNPQTKAIKNFDVSDGLVSNEFRKNSCFKSNDGRFFFGGIGVNVFYPDSIKTNQYIPTVFLTGLKIFNKTVNIQAEDSILQQHISETREITLDREFNFFTIEYVGINFTNSNKNQFAYKLEGFDKNWVNAGKQRFATFTNLDPGQYTFHVKASNNDGLWNETGARLIINILPYWYETLLFQGLIALLAVLFFIGIFFYRTHAITRRNHYLEKVVKERTAKLAVVNDELLNVNKTLSATNQSLDHQRELALEAINTREQFLSIMSHEIRTPLNSMIGLTHVLKQRGPRPDQKEIIDTLKNSSDHLMHLVNDILDFNKIKANMLELEHSRFNLNEVLHQIHAMFYRMANDKNLSFIIKVDSTMPVNLMGDPTRLIQILSNLIGNAIKFTPTGSIDLNVHPSKIEGKIVLAEFHINDTGIGIPSDRISSIFKPFLQINNAHKNAGGTGLGLTIVKSLTEIMKGDLQVQSKLGTGTSFIVTIPFEFLEQSHSTNNQLPYHRINLKNTKVLYVEDVESNQFLINNLLADYEIICSNANNGEEAKVAIQESKYDVILLDIQMPDMTGYEVASIIRKDPLSKNQNTPIILFSASTNIREDKIKECEANDFIGKPFKPENLIEKIRGFLKENASI